MRKNKMMRAASALLVAVLLTTSTISGTFAKYVTETKASDAARVAKWGVELQVVGNLYGDSYEDVDGTNSNKIVENKGDVTVQSYNTANDNNAVNGDDVVAPGTENEDGFTFSLNGRPEVDGLVTHSIEVQNIFLKKGTYGVMIPFTTDVVNENNYTEFFEKDGGGNYIVQLYYKDGDIYKPAPETYNNTIAEYYTLEDKVVLTKDYYPVVYTLNGAATNGTTLAGLDHNADSLVAVANKIVEQLTSSAQSFVYDDENGTWKFEYTTGRAFNSNTDLAEELKLTAEEITWKWAFERATDTDMYNGADTILGMLIAKDIAAIDVDNVDYYTTPDADNFEVVKADGENFVQLTAYANDVTFEKVDYCVRTKFDLEITVEQVD